MLPTVETYGEVVALILAAFPAAWVSFKGGISRSYRSLARQTSQLVYVLANLDVCLFLLCRDIKKL